MESLTSIINPVFSLVDLLLTSSLLPHLLGTVYDLYCLSCQFSGHIKRISTEKSLTSIESGRAWLSENSSNLNRYKNLFNLIALCILCYFLIQNFL